MNIHNAVNTPIGLTIRVQSAASTSDSEGVQRGRETKKTAVGARCWLAESNDKFFTVIHNSTIVFLHRDN